MPRIERLPDDIANQIAAGEVVERPASVVKELCENALDAGATRVRVDIEGGGVVLIRVSDDGFGMDEVDARLAVERHATSKIRKLDDLMSLSTFGFRGEALPSIASVSRFTLRTRERAVDEGVEIRVDAGAAASVRPAGVAPGTTIEVRDLFFNVPARRKFLKATGTESAHVTEAVESMALGAPSLTVTLSRDGRVVREWLRQPTRAARVRESFAGEELAELSGTRGFVTVEALLGRPERARATTASLKLFVNGRAVRDRVLQRTVCQAYGSVLPPGRYPVGAVYVEVPSDRVDVNVHPQKAEVRFADGRTIADAVFSVLSLELGKAFGLAPANRSLFGGARVASGAEAKADAAPERAAWAWSSGEAGPPPAVAEADPWGFGVAPASPSPVAPSPSVVSPPIAYPPLERDLLASPEDASARYGRLRFVAQVRSTFLVCEGDDGLYVLDQHAAAERVTFDRLKRAFASRAVAVQPLLFPEVVEVPPEDAALVEEEHELLLAAGIDARVVGPTKVAVHGVPQILARAKPERLLRDLLAEASRGGRAAFRDAVDLALATMACHGSIRAGDHVAPEEAVALLAALDKVDFAGHCPHGRPIITILRWPDLERRVGRR
jgi:DNA mismatch repair protein MutL